MQSNGTSACNTSAERVIEFAVSEDFVLSQALYLFANYITFDNFGFKPNSLHSLHFIGVGRGGGGGNIPFGPPIIHPHFPSISM